MRVLGWLPMVVASSPLVDTAVSGAFTAAADNVISGPGMDLKNTTTALRGHVNETQDTVVQLTDQAVFGGSLSVLYVALLQVLLFQQGGPWAPARTQA